jgi:hypothetical protein
VPRTVGPRRACIDGSLRIGKRIVERGEVGRRRDVVRRSGLERKRTEMHVRVNVEHVEPHHRPAALVPVFVPALSRRQDEVTVGHRGERAVDFRYRSAALEHKTQRVRRVPMRPSHLTRQQDLQAGVEVGDRLEVSVASVRIDEREDAPFRTRGRRQRNRALHQRFHRSPRPDLRLSEVAVGAMRLRDLPQRLHAGIAPALLDFFFGELAVR